MGMFNVSKSLFAVALAALVSMGVSDSTSFTIHVVGDSTVQTYAASAYPQTGWGQVIGNFFDASRVKINNAALGGRSSRTFIEEGRLDALGSSMQPGDFLFIQFGHNDRDYSKAARYVEPSQFPGYIQKYIDFALKHKATPILISPMNLNGSRNVFSTGDKNYDARGMMQTLATKNKIPFVDLNMKSYNTYNTTYKSMPDYVTRYLYKSLQAGEYPNYPNGVNDGTTHFQEMGSMGHSLMIAEELERNLSSNSNLTADAKAALTTLVSTLKKRYTIKVKTNLSNYSGLITQTQYFPAGSPMTLRVTPNSGKFQKWVDDDCKELSKSQIYYGFKTPARNITYTAMFEGGAACTPIAHDDEDATTGVAESSSSGVDPNSSSSINPELCADAGDSKWPSVIEMFEPEVSDGFSESNHTGYTGKGFYNIANSAYSEATYRLTSDRSASNARVMIRYAFEGNANRDMKFTIDNGTYDVAFPSTGSWDKWDTVYIEDVWVDALDFKMKIQSTTADGGPNIDMIAFSIEGVYRTGCKAPSSTAMSSSVQTPVSSSSATSEANSSSTVVPANSSSSMSDSSRTKVKVLYDANLKHQKVVSIYVMDGLGRIVAKMSRQAPIPSANQILGELDLPKGKYIIRLK